MSAHPNVVLLLLLTPEDLTRRTMKKIVEMYDGQVHEDEDETSREIKIAGENYYIEPMEGNYLESWQISGKEGDIAVFDLVTYGYGESIVWEKLEKQKQELEKWAKAVCEQFHCNYQIFITANYW